MIGVYDSGIGGLSVWRELHRIMPAEDYVYVADTAYCPYGEKPRQIITERGEKITRFLVERGAGLVVVACNTATAAAIGHLRREFDIPFVGMEPAVKSAASLSKSGVIGVLATANTFKGSLYRKTMCRYASDVKVVEKIGYGLVEAIEKREMPEKLIEKYVGEMLDEGADVIVLGCTHYNFLREKISRIAGSSAAVINSAPAVALQAQRLVKKFSLSSAGGTSKFFSTGDISVLRDCALSLVPSITEDCFETLKNF